MAGGGNFILVEPGHPWFRADMAPIPHHRKIPMQRDNTFFMLRAAGFLLLLATPPSLWARADGPVAAAHFFAYQPKAGMQAQFDQGYREHLAWHRGKHDPLAWYGWYVSQGERAGQFIDASVGVPFAAMDRRVDPAGDAANYRKTFAPYGDPASRTSYVLLPALGTGQPLEDMHPSASVQVLHYTLRPGTEARFESAIAAVRDVLSGIEGAPAHTWYRLVAGGRQPQYMLMIARDDWASYDRFRKMPGEWLAGPDSAAGDDYAAAVLEVDSEIWNYRADLSYIPAR
jgi:hypothetical protein